MGNNLRIILFLFLGSIVFDLIQRSVFSGTKEEVKPHQHNSMEDLRDEHAHHTHFQREDSYAGEHGVKITDSRSGEDIDVDTEGK